MKQQIVGLHLDSACQPGMLWKDTTGPTGVLTLQCGCSFSNATSLTLLVWAISRYPDGRRGQVRHYWTLEPGSTVLVLEPPPAGSYWTLYTQTSYQRNYGNAFKVAGGAAVVGLALFGGWTLVSRRRRRR